MAERYTVDGFAFADEKAAEQARKEMEGIKYIRSKLDTENPEQVLEIYRRIVSQNLFETPVGICFLRELQETLRLIPRTRGEEIEPIPVNAEPTRPVKPEREAGAKRESKSHTVVREKHINYKRRYRLLTAVCTVLLLIVISMFAITLTGNSPNILNYENKLINKYEMWEERLKDREERLKLREQQIGQVYTEETEWTN